MLLGMSFGSVALLLLLVIPVFWFGIKFVDKVLQAREDKEPRVIRKLSKIYETEKDIDEHDKKFSGFHDPDEVVSHLQDVLTALKSKKPFRLRASEAAFIASEIGEHITKSDDGRYFIMSEAAVAKYIKLASNMTVKGFVRRLNEIEEILKPEKVNGKYVVDFAEAIYRIRNSDATQAIGESYLFEMQQYASGGADNVINVVAVNRPIAAPAVPNAEVKRHQALVAWAKRRDKNGNRIFQWRDGSKFVIHSDGRKELIEAKREEEGEREMTPFEKISSAA